MRHPPGILTRRSFLWIGLLLIISGVLWVLPLRVRTARQIAEFFGLDRETETVIDQILENLRNQHRRGYRESALFFALDHHGLNFLIPSDWRDRVISFWSDSLFLRRSVAWPYIHYPQYNDLLICDGLIRNRD